MAPKLRPLLAVFDGIVTYLRRKRSAGHGNVRPFPFDAHSI